MAKLGNLASRILVGLIAGPILAFIMYLERPEPLWGLVFAASLMAMYEFFAMALDDPGDRKASMFFGAVCVAGMYWLQPMALFRLPGEGYPLDARVLLASMGPVLVLVAAVVPVGLYYLFRVGDMKTVATRFAYSVTGIVYVGLTLTFLALMRRDFGEHGPDVVLFVLAVVWVGDTGAYFGGRFFGKTKLYPAVSPKKTWAGAIGGLVGSVATAAVLRLTLMDYLPWVHIMALAIPGAVLGQLGDLVESLFKRATGVKDSGAILPGHGGILDRVDAVLFVAPYTYLYLMLIPALS
jgi:phosphatidate cytidylyltransferase